ncbi:MAG: M23 family metallopeptidase [Myxococcota bacterium]
MPIGVSGGVISTGGPSIETSGSAAESTGDGLDDGSESGLPDVGNCVGGDCPDTCTPPDPFLPFPAETSMGVSLKPGCPPSHVGDAEHAYDFNIAGSYEMDNDLVAAASSDGVVVQVLDGVVGSCDPDLGIPCDASYNGGWGNCVVVMVDGGCGEVFERYCHLDEGAESIFVSEGQHVCHGTPLGRIGTTGRSTGSHLHWQREDASGHSIPVGSFQEVDVPGGCEWCNVVTNYDTGCYTSANQLAPECAAPPTGPCTGVSDGHYCGSNDALGGYPGDDDDLVTCDDGHVVDVIPCADGCQQNPPGTPDECLDPPGPECGNGMIDPGEECDGTDVDGATCGAEGYDAGTVSCTPTCQLDVSQCCADQCSPGTTTCGPQGQSTCVLDGACHDWSEPIECPYGCDGTVCNNITCGNGVVEAGEACDGGQLGGSSCGSLGYDEGVLGCTASCQLDVTGCCNDACTLGDSQCLGAAEQQCEATPGSCNSWGPAVPCPLGCAGGECIEPFCGDGTVNAGEQCDGGNLGGNSCGGLGYDGGSLGCTATCQLDVSGCCDDACTLGDSQCLGNSEQACQPTATCNAWGIPNGCMYGCAGGECIQPSCGDGMVTAGEQCDGGNLGGNSCWSLGYDGGNLGCTGSCQFDYSGCCQDECNAGQSQCLGNSEQSCQTFGACNTWGPPSACGALGCAGGECVQPFCGDGMITAGEQCDGWQLGGQSCLGLGYDGGSLSCNGTCNYNTSSCCEQEHEILNAQWPLYTSNASGCTNVGGIALNISAQFIGTSQIRFRVRKTDGTAWNSPADLTLYVGVGPTCGNPPNVPKVHTPVIVGQTIQNIYLQVEPYDAAWAMGEAKEFWVGKSEGPWAAARSSGTITVQRVCNP